MDATRVSAGEWSERARTFRQEGWQLSDLCGLDTLGLPGSKNRFEVAVQLIHHDRKERTTVHVIAEGEPPMIPSATEIWATANFMEREAFDMFGIVFEGHPNLTRILMPDEWEGYPLRKDYGVGKIPVEFVPQPFLQIEAPGQSPSASEAGISVDELGQPLTSEKERADE